MPPSTEKQVFKNVIVVKIGIVSFNIFHVFKLQPLRVAPQTPTTASLSLYAWCENNIHQNISPFQVVMFLVHRPPSFLKNVKFQKYMGKMSASAF